MSPDKIPPVSIVRCECPSSAVHRGEILRVAIELKNNTGEARSLVLWFDVVSLDRKPLTSYPFFKPAALRLEAQQAYRQDAHILVPHGAAPNRYLLCLAVGPAAGTKWDERVFEISVDLQRKRVRNRCNLCGEEVREDGLIWQDPSIRLAECPSCGLVFDFDMEDEHSLTYELAQVCAGGLTFEKDSPSIIEDYDRRNEIVLTLETERIREEIGPGGKRLLDFGCGTGGLLVEARRAGFEVYGVETNADAIAFARSSQGLAVFASAEGLRRAGAGDGFFDVIVARHTLEHVPNPTKTLEEFRKLLRPGGLLVTIVPHFSFVTRRILPNSMPRFSYGLIHKGHQYYFTRKTLGRYLRDAGFRDIAFRYSLLGGFLSRWIEKTDSSAISPRERVLSRASKALSSLLHLARLSPVLTAYAK